MAKKSSKKMQKEKQEMYKKFGAIALAVASLIFFAIVVSIYAY